MVVFVEGVTALRAELRRILGIFRLPAALVTAIEGSFSRFRAAAVRAEFSLINLTAGAGPAL